MKLSATLISILIPLLLIALTSSQPYFCSAFCSQSSCTGTTSSSCTSSCPTNWLLTGSTCLLDATSNYTLVGQSPDIPGGTNVTVSPSAQTTCPPYTYYGNNQCSTPFTITITPGVDYYSLTVAVWVIFGDDKTWSTAKNINMAVGTVTQSVSMASSGAQSNLCSGNDVQTYYRASFSFTPINGTSPVTATLSSDVTNSQCTWGMKEVIATVQKCNSICLTCFGPDSTKCYSCIASYYLSGNTCSTSCLAGYGTVTSSFICVLCDLKCVVCS